MLTKLSVVAMVSLAFGVVGIVACALCKDVDHKMTNKVSNMISAYCPVHAHRPMTSRSKFILKTLSSLKRTSTTDFDVEDCR
jgi:hypothetical protein